VILLIKSGQILIPLLFSRTYFMKIGLFYGSTTCYTEIVAEKIQQQISEFEVEIFNIKETPLSDCENFDILIFGISTWDYGEIQEDWESHWQEVSSLHLSDKIIALYGMGDQIGYTDWFQDALGLLHDEILPQDPLIIGRWKNEGYEFNASKALIEDGAKFVGLALDEDSQYALTDERIAKWCNQIETEIKEILAA